MYRKDKFEERLLEFMFGRRDGRFEKVIWKREGISKGLIFWR
jgi:hypothetical protein